MTLAEQRDDCTLQVWFRASYDYRDDPRDERGAHGMEIHFTLRGPLGAITSVVSTGWMLRPLSGLYAPTGARQQRLDRPGPDAADMGHPKTMWTALHSPVAGQPHWDGPTECDVLASGRCWTAGSYLMGARVLAGLVAGGCDGVWREMRRLYDALLVAGVAP